jgi:pyridoxamine 5'-phosphate oxidase
VTSALPPSLPEDPLPLALGWLADAAELTRRNTNAMALATRDERGRPSVRMVLLKELAPEGYAVFYTNYGSRKAAELATGRAAAVLYWDELGRQLRFEGVVVRSPAEESDAYFATRPWRSQVNAWSSRQSQPLPDPAELTRRAAAKSAELGMAGDAHEPPAGRRLPRPEFWGGYRLWLDALELWVEGADRFHERWRYARALAAGADAAFRTGPWSRQRLQP